MKIIFDCRYVRWERHDGISRFSVGLVTALARLTPVTMLIHDMRQLAVLPALPWVMGPSPTAATEPITARFVNKYEPDVVFTPMQTMGPFGRRFAFVTTVHDLIYYSNPTPPRDLAWPVRALWRLYHLSYGPQRFVLRKADAHVAVSATTRQLMIDNHLTPHPIAVVSNAVDSIDATPRIRPTGKNLVYMGSFMPYKNVETLASAMALLPGYTLHLLSKASADDQARLTALAPAGSLSFHGGATDAEYFALLRDADALVTASLNEGFGLPLIEAMGVGTPIVVSDIPVFREIGGEAPVYFEALSPESFAAAVRVLDEPGDWERRSAASVVQATPYNWDTSARALLTLLEQTVAGA